MKLKNIFGIICTILLLVVNYIPVCSEKSNDISSKYTIVTPCKYYSMGGYYYGLSAVADSSKKYGLIDTVGKVVLPFKYESLNFVAAYYDKGLVVKNLYCAKLKGESGIIDSEGTQIIPFNYELINVDKWTSDDGVPNEEDTPWNSINDIFFRVYNNGKTGLIDSKGEFIIPAQYNFLDLDAYIGNDGIKQGFAIALMNSKYYILDKNGNKLLTSGYDLIKDLGYGQILLGTGQVSGHINGEPFIFGSGDVYDLVRNKAICKSRNSIIDYYYGDKYYIPMNEKDGTRTVIDRSGKTVISGGTYSYILQSDEVFIVGKVTNGIYYYGIADLSGKLIQPVEYQRIDPFKEGVAFAQKNSGYGVITKSGSTSFIYTNCGVYNNGVYELTVNNKTTIYNKNGTIIGAAGKYSSIAGICGELTFVKRGNKIGAIDTDGNVVLSPVYDSFIGLRENYTDANKSLVILKRDGGYVAVNSKGQEILKNIGREQADYIAFSDNYIFYYDKMMNSKIFDQEGNLLLEKKISNFNFRENGYIVIFNNSGCALLDKNCNTIIDFGEFDSIHTYSDSIAIVTRKGLCGIIKLSPSTQSPIPIEKLPVDYTVEMAKNNGDFINFSGQSM